MAGQAPQAQPPVRVPARRRKGPLSRSGRAVATRTCRPACVLLAAYALIAAETGAQEPSASGDDFTIVGPAFIAIQVEDVDDAARWYRSALRLSEVDRLEAADGAYSIRILSDGRLTVELIRQRGAAPQTAVPHLGLFKAGFFVDDIDAAFRWLESIGADTDASVFYDRTLDVHSFVFRDPFGNRIQVFQR